MGPCKVRNETETKRNETKQIETKRNKSKRNETDRNETKQIETKRNKTKRNKSKRNETNCMECQIDKYSINKIVLQSTSSVMPFLTIKVAFSNIKNLLPDIENAFKLLILRMNFNIKKSLVFFN